MEIVYVHQFIVAADGTIEILEVVTRLRPVAPEILIALRLEYLREELRAERLSWGELAELQYLAEYIHHSDVELLEAAGVPEFAEDL